MKNYFKPLKVEITAKYKANNNQLGISSFFGFSKTIPLNKKPYVTASE